MPPAIPRPRRRSGRTARRCRGSTKSRRRCASTARTCALRRARRRCPAVSSPPPRSRSADLRDDEQHRQVVAIAAAAARRSRRSRRSATRAPSELPIVLPCRAASSARFTSSRMRDQPLPALHQIARRPAPRPSARGGNSARWTDASRGPGRCRHISSAVTGRIGAEQAREAVGDQVHRGLRRAALRRIRRRTCRADPSTRRRRTPTGRPSPAG